MPSRIRHLAITLMAPLLIGTALAQHAGVVLDDKGGKSAGDFAFGEPAPASLATRTVRIEIRDSLFNPSSISVRRGEIVRFVIANTSDLDHEFVLGDPGTQRAHRAEMARMAGSPSMMMDSDPNGVSVAPHRTGELTWRFSGAAPVEYDCDIPGHYEAGMHGAITLD